VELIFIVVMLLALMAAGYGLGYIVGSNSKKKEVTPSASHIKVGYCWSDRLMHYLFSSRNN
jgi:flagellar basal body-associated protein FliL